MGISYGMGFLGLLQELPGLMVEPTDGDLFFFENLPQLIQVRPILNRLQLHRHGPRL
jgi:hypothetical protein